MKLYTIILFLCVYNFSYSQSTDIEFEKQIIKETLSQYLNTNPNSIATYIKGSKGYEMLRYSLVEAFVFNDKATDKKELDEQYAQLDLISDSIVDALKTTKISVRVIDTLFAYKYLPMQSNLQNETDWKNNLPYLLADFKENNAARMDTIIGVDYIHLLKKQINYKGKDSVFVRKELNNSYYEYVDYKQTNPDKMYLEALKIYRPVFNKDYTKGCYLFSFRCRDKAECRSFLFIKKVGNHWIYVDEYPSWIIDEA